MNCKKATQLLSEQLDRPLTQKEKIALKFHLGMCFGCRNFSRHMKKIHSISKDYVKGDDQ
ncbi:MAG: hypothetical protein CENE_02085 [Candidatus Celerinatantimonas neptuna]|nr:MAG: hypothetical protein CENE_02085 [Candidatus Celerinatantimonas neptuna]